VEGLLGWWAILSRPGGVSGTRAAAAAVTRAEQQATSCRSISVPQVSRTSGSRTGGWDAVELLLLPVCMAAGCSPATKRKRKWKWESDQWTAQNKR